jgi:kynurenine formamidase
VAGAIAYKRPDIGTLTDRRLNGAANTGTYIDGPLRFDPDGTSIEKIPVEEFLLPICVLDLRHPSGAAS